MLETLKGRTDALEPTMVTLTEASNVFPLFQHPAPEFISALLSTPLTFIMTNDAFNFGVLPILSETAGQFGVEPAKPDPKRELRSRSILRIFYQNSFAVLLVQYPRTTELGPGHVMDTALP